MFFQMPAKTCSDRSHDNLSALKDWNPRSSANKKTSLNSIPQTERQTQKMCVEWVGRCELTAQRWLWKVLGITKIQKHIKKGEPEGSTYWGEKKLKQMGDKAKIGVGWFFLVDGFGKKEVIWEKKSWNGHENGTKKDAVRAHSDVKRYNVQGWRQDGCVRKKSVKARSVVKRHEWEH